MRHTVDVVFTILLFTVFAASVLMVLVTGANTYKKIEETGSKDTSERACVMYAATKLRHYDTRGTASLVKFGDGEAMALTEAGDEGGRYITYIYNHNGDIMELYVEEGDETGPDAGEKIFSGASISFADRGGGLWDISCKKDGRTFESSVYLRGDGGAEK